MFLYEILSCLLYIAVVIADKNFDKRDWKSDPKDTTCLTGYMTDVQKWVDKFGRLNAVEDINTSSITISSREGINKLQYEVANFKSTQNRRIRYMSMVSCRLTRVPAVFKWTDRLDRSLADTLVYLTLYGNNFGTLDKAETYDVALNASNTHEINMNTNITTYGKQLTLWSVGFQAFTFSNLRELDLRSCSIQALGSHTFQRMPKLRNLYLGENNIHYIETNAFSSLTALKHLDLSRNYAYDENGQQRDMYFESLDILRNLNLESLDLSFTNFGQRNINILKGVERKLKRLSICYAGLNRIRDDVFYFPSMKYLDVSGNYEILSTPNVFRDLNNSLQILFAENVALRNMNVFQNLSNLEILKLTNNEIVSIPPHVAHSLKKLQILDLDNNRIAAWFSDLISYMKNLKLLSLKSNNINLVTREMYYDVENLTYISLSGNFLICNCHARDIYEVGLKNELKQKTTLITELNRSARSPLSFHTGFQYFNDIIRQRSNLTSICKEAKNCNSDFSPDVVGNYLFLDTNDLTDMYACLIVTDGVTKSVSEIDSCFKKNREFDMPDEYIRYWNKFLLFIIPGVLFPLLCFVYVFRKNLRYFVITMRNSAMLSLIHKKDVYDDGSIFNYDVFVSYCNEDRAWVLDQLLPHVERDCNVSVCLHERDFQVGLSILENIVSCMDRSRSIMLIISKRFLLSQWCQFEMHLAQHRLLETRREDLILILLEEIPRRLRPNTLHYLMLTKTYIVWPKEESEHSLFWRRMKKSLTTHKLKQDNVSLA
ncbi:toll-like receptor 13 [Vanessa atalanta]|uniref:toll-like receptor 13 n=1 Tax=Vanessa atalanta TaxID=42275 RepID=UPI001FCD4544|nr:toll-like receptor 13 [Vanessa atalanta]